MLASQRRLLRKCENAAQSGNARKMMRALRRMKEAMGYASSDSGKFVAAGPQFHDTTRYVYSALAPVMPVPNRPC